MLYSVVSVGQLFQPEVSFAPPHVVNVDKSKHSARCDPWHVLVGSFITRAEADMQIKKLCKIEKAVQGNNLMKKSPILLMLENMQASTARLYFMDRSGIIPCILATPEWIAVTTEYTFCLTAWSKVRAIDTMTPPTAYTYLEIASPPSLIPKNHFLGQNPCQEFTSEIYDPTHYSDHNVYRGCKDTLDQKKYNQLQGKVMSKSPVIVTAENACFFLIELKVKYAGNPNDEEDNCDAESQQVAESVYIFAQPKCSRTDMVLWHERMAVGKRYLFKTLTPTRIRLESKQSTESCNKKSMFRFAFDEMAVSILDDPIFDFSRFISKSQTTDSKSTLDVNNPFDYLKGNDTARIVVRHELKSFVGRITKVFDPILGLYELDHDIQLYSFFSGTPADGRGFRIGSVVDIRNVHVVCVSVEKDHEPDSWRLVQVILIACDVTCIKIAEFSLETQESLIYRKKDQIALMDTIGKLNGLDWIFMYVIKNAWESKFNIKGLDSPTLFRDAVASDLEHMLPFLKKFGYSPFNNRSESVFNKFMQHASTCQVATIRYALPTLPLISRIFKRDAFIGWVNDLIEMAEQGMRYDSKDYFCQSFQRKNVSVTDEDVWLVGKLCQDDMGHFMLEDVSGKILVYFYDLFGPCVENLYPIHPEWLGRVVALKDFDIVVELCGLSTLPPSENVPPFDLFKLSKYNHKLYARCDMQNVVVFPDITSSPQKADASFNVLLFRVTHKTRPHMKLDNSTRGFFMETWIYGVSWFASVQRKDNIWSLSFLTEARPSMCLLPKSCFTWHTMMHSDHVYAFSHPVLYVGPNPVAMDSVDESFFSHIDDELTFAATKSDPPILVNIENQPGLNDSQRCIFATVLDQESFDMSKNPPCLNTKNMGVKEVLKMGQEYMQDVPATEYLNDKLITIEGMIVLRDMRDEEEFSDMFTDLTVKSEQLFVKKGIGIGKPGRRLFLRLRDMDEFDIQKTSDGVFPPLIKDASSSRKQCCIDVYMDLKTAMYPLSLVPGVVIRLDKCLLRFSKAGNMYITTLPVTHIQVRQAKFFMHLDSKPAPSSTLPNNNRILLSDLYFKHDLNTLSMMSVKVMLRFIRAIEISNVCRVCFNQTRAGQCIYGCFLGQNEQQTMFEARVECYVEDGTSFAQLIVDRIESVMQLLGVGRMHHGHVQLGVAGKKQHERWTHLMNQIEQKGHLKVELGWFADQSDRLDGNQDEDGPEKEPSAKDKIYQQLYKKTAYVEEEEMKKVLMHPKLFRPLLVTCRPRFYKTRIDPKTSSESSFSSSSSHHLTYNAYSLNHFRYRDFKHDRIPLRVLNPPQISLQVLHLEEVDPLLEIRHLVQNYI